MLRKIDITTTATLRPSLLDRTFFSFKEKMIKNHDVRIIINVDLIGEDCNREVVGNIVQNYFDNYSIFYTENPGFSKAVIKCWKETCSKYVFHLEEDWILNVDVDLDNMISVMEKNPNLVSLRLNKDKTRNINGSKDFVYYEKLSLNPTLFRADFIRNISKYMDSSLNPEKQLRKNAPGKRGELLKYVHHGIYTGSGYNPIVTDIGREWMNKSKFDKETGFTEWRLKDVN